MRLLVFAHRGEAQIFLSQKKCEAISQNLYRTQDNLVLICGEGRDLAMIHTAKVIGEWRKEITEVYNLGVCACLNPMSGLAKFDVVIPSTIYAHNESSPEFHSFKNALPREEKTKPLHIITTPNRVLDPAYAEKISNFAQLVDREAWAVAKVCKEFNIPLKVIKTVSDFPSKDAEICQRVKEDALLFSQKLWDAFTDLAIDNEQEDKDSEEGHPLFSAYHFSLSQKREFFSLKSVLQSKKIDWESRIDFVEIDETKGHAKIKTKKLLLQMHYLAYPFTGKIETALSNIKSPFEKNGVKIFFPEKLEGDTISFQIKTNSSEIFLKTVQKLKDFPFQKASDLLAGKIDV